MPKLQLQGGSSAAGPRTMLLRGNGPPSHQRQERALEPVFSREPKPRLQVTRSVKKGALPGLNLALKEHLSPTTRDSTCNRLAPRDWRAVPSAIPH